MHAAVFFALFALAAAQTTGLPENMEGEVEAFMDAVLMNMCGEEPDALCDEYMPKVISCFGDTEEMPEADDCGPDVIAFLDDAEASYCAGIGAEDVLCLMTPEDL